MARTGKKNPKLSISIFPLSLGGSNAPRLELEAIFTPPYNAAGKGISLTGSPRQADIVMLIGSGTAKVTEHALRLIASLPDDVKLVALGSETISGKPFAESYATVGPVLPGDSDEDSSLKLPAGKKLSAYIAGSPPDPQAIIAAILEVATPSTMVDENPDG